MNRMERTILLAVILLGCCLLLFGCNDSAQNINVYDDQVLLSVNHDSILASELNEIKQQYAQTPLSESELMQGILLETFTLQQANDKLVSVSEEEIRDRIDSFKTLDNGFFYEKALQKYSDEIKIYEALKYKLIFERIKGIVQEESSNVYPINHEFIQMRTKEYVSQYEYINTQEYEEFSADVYHAYEEIFSSKIAELYFRAWQYSIVDKDSINYKGYSKEDLFHAFDYSIEEEMLKIDDEEYLLGHLPNTYSFDAFEGIFYMPRSLYERDTDRVIKYIDMPERNLKCLDIKLNHNLPIIIKLVMTPKLALLYKEDSVIYTDLEDGKTNRIDIILGSLGVHYTIESELNFKELKEVLYKCIPFTFAQNNTMKE